MAWSGRRDDVQLAFRMPVARRHSGRVFGGHYERWENTARNRKRERKMMNVRIPDHMKGAIKKLSKLLMVVDERFVRLDGFPSDPLNTKRVINTSILCDDVLEAKDFNFYPEDIERT